MDTALLERLVREILRNEVTSNGFYWLTLSCVVLVSSVVGSYLGAYFKKKAEDKATLEALEKITRTVEDVKNELKARHTLRFAALDKRLQAHQDAFMHVLSLVSVFYSEKEYILKALRECRIWYSENALFLDPKAKAAFNSSYTAAQQQSWRH